jgi:hypothetical protein
VQGYDESSGLLPLRWHRKASFHATPTWKLQLSVDIENQWKQDATKVIKKAETQNLSRNGLTFRHEQSALIVTKGLEWKAISTFR